MAFSFQIWIFRVCIRQLNIEDAQLDVTKFDFMKELRKNTFDSALGLWTSRSGAKSVFLNLSRDKIKNSYMAPLRGVYSSFLDEYKPRINIAGFHIRTNNILFFKILCQIKICSQKSREIASG